MHLGPGRPCPVPVCRAHPRYQVGVVRDDGERAFRVLSNEEVDHYLTLISERD